MAKKKPTRKRRPGRPKGAKTKQRDVAVGTLTRCKGCGSTDREPYTGVREMNHEGVDDDGNAFNVITWKRTQCSNCGQNRVDQTFENRAE